MVGDLHEKKTRRKVLMSERVMVVNANSAIFQLLHGKSEFIFNEIMMSPL